MKYCDVLSLDNVIIP